MSAQAGVGLVLAPLLQVFPCAELEYLTSRSRVGVPPFQVLIQLGCLPQIFQRMISFSVSHHSHVARLPPSAASSILPGWRANDDLPSDASRHSGR